jgi:hypothetical protein
LRGTFGIHIAKIAAAFKLDVEDRLASIIPAKADTGDDDRSFRRLYLYTVDGIILVGSPPKVPEHWQRKPQRKSWPRARDGTLGWIVLLR